MSDQRYSQEENPQEEQNQQYWNGYDDHGFRNTTDPGYGPIPEEYESNMMSRMAYACGIVSVICVFLSAFVFGASFVIGALGILFALLSRRNKFSRQARHAIRLCSIGMASTVLILLLALAVVIRSGMWDSIVNAVNSIDPNDPNSVTVVQQELMDELLARYGVEYGDSAGSDSEGSESEASDAESSGSSSAGTLPEISADPAGDGMV